MSAANKKVTLKDGIKNGDKKITELTIREPSAGELRGIAVVDIARMDVSAYITLLPRITTPTLNTEQINSMSFPDITSVMDKVTDFLEPAD